jgi:acetate kinase
MRVLAVNCGSSSLKFDLFDATVAAEPARLAAGIVERIGPEATYSLDFDGRRLTETRPVPDHRQAFDAAFDLLSASGLAAGMEAIGHRVVHGGAHFREATPIDEAVIEAIEAASQLAPLHNRPALAAIEAARARAGSIPMVASFDTAYYADLPEVAALYALPRDLSERLGIRRYGFHGLAHHYMVERYRALRPDVERPRLITLQLGNGCSATASVDGRPLDTSMGFTPLEGLIMGTRPGDLDPAIPLFLAQRGGFSLDQIEALLNNESGLRGLSGRSNDMRDLLQAEADGDERAALAVEAFCYRVRKYAGAYLAVLGGADALVFGGGIGEHSAAVRQRICAGLRWAGLALDTEANDRESGKDRRISAAGSGIEAWVVAVDEAAVIAKEVVACLGKTAR